MSGGSGGSASATGGLSLTSKGDLLTNSAVADGIEWATPAGGGATINKVMASTMTIYNYATEYHSMQGGGSATKNLVVSRAFQTMTVSKLWLNVTANNLDVDEVLTLYDDDVATSLAITIPDLGVGVVTNDVDNSGLIGSGSILYFLDTQNSSTGEAVIPYGSYIEAY